VVEDLKNGVVIRRETTGGEFKSRIEVYNEAGKLQTLDTTDKNGVNIRRELKGGKWFETTTGPSQFDTRLKVWYTKRLEVWNEARTTLLERTTWVDFGDRRNAHPDFDKGWLPLHIVFERVEEKLQDNGNWIITRIGNSNNDSIGLPCHLSIRNQTEVYETMGGKLLSYDREYYDVKSNKELSGVKIHNQWIGDKWVEFTRWPDGSYWKNVWKKQDHGGEGSDDHISKSVLDKKQGFFQVFRYHVYANVWYWGADYGRDNVWEGRQWSLNKDGTPNFNDLTQYNVHSSWGYDNWWYKPGTMAGIYSNGWTCWRYGNPPALDNPGQYLA
jgi:hypothetical protein